MEIARVIFERGIQAGHGENGLKLSGAFASVVAEVRATYGVRPIILAEIVPVWGGGKHERYQVLPSNGDGTLNLRASSLQLPQGLSEELYKSLVRPMLNIRYTVSALVYQCQQLALVYAELNAIAKGMVAESRGGSLAGAAAFNLQGQPEGYFEFDALISSARRAYDSLRYILWTAFGLKTEHLPSNFKKTIQVCGRRLPKPLQDALVESWASHGEKMTKYRDCIQHYVPVSFGIDTVCCKRLDAECWSVCLRIPDNPEARSARGFTFHLELDALTYGWEVASEITQLATKIFEALPEYAGISQKANSP